MWNENIFILSGIIEQGQTVTNATVTFTVGHTSREIMASTLLTINNKVVFSNSNTASYRG